MFQKHGESSNIGISLFEKGYLFFFTGINIRIEWWPELREVVSGWSGTREASGT